MIPMALAFLVALAALALFFWQTGLPMRAQPPQARALDDCATYPNRAEQIGRASCRERV